MAEDVAFGSNTFVFLITKEDGTFKPDRIILSCSSTYPKIFALKVLGIELITNFNMLFDVDVSKAIDPKKSNQIIGAISVFKIPQNVYNQISKNEDLSDMNIVLNSSKDIYGIIKRFLLTNNENYSKSINEVIAYIDVEIKTQLIKYGVKDEDFVTDHNLIMFLMLSGKQKPYSEEAQNMVSSQYKNTKDSQSEAKNTNQYSESSLDKELSAINKTTGKTKGRSVWKSLWDYFKEHAIETPEERKRRVETEMEEAKSKLELEDKKLDLIERRKKLRESMENDAQANEKE